MNEALQIRQATLSEIGDIEQLIQLSARKLSRDDYTDEQIEAALGTAWGVDTQLIKDGTYFVVKAGNQLVGCGGWSRRRTLFGTDQLQGREPNLLDPPTEAAKIRAFFVHPNWARKGIGRALLDRCEEEATAEGFQAFELVATLPGIRLYEAAGFMPTAEIDHPLSGGLTIRFVKMQKQLRTQR